MGQIIYGEKCFCYNESEHKPLLLVLKDNGIIINNKDNNIYLYYGNFVSNGQVFSYSDSVISADDMIPIGDLKIRKVNRQESTSLIDTKADEKVKNFGAVIELGDYEITMTLYNLTKKEAITSYSEKNKQSDIAYSVKDRLIFNKNDSKKQLHTLLVNQINDMIENICSEYLIETDSITQLVAAGSTPMLHLFSGMEMTENQNGDFEEQSLFGIKYIAKMTGIKINKNAVISYVPCINSSVGGNFLFKICPCKTMNKELIIDFSSFVTIGFLCDDKIYVSSSTAENYEITGISGHITGSVTGTSESQNGNIHLKTIDDTTPEGITLPGLIDVIGALKSKGNFSEENKKDVEIGNYKISYQDINNFISLKGYINNAVNAILKNVKLDMSDIVRVSVSNNCDEKISLSALTELQLIPDELVSKLKNHFEDIICYDRLRLFTDCELDRLQELSENSITVKI